MSTYSTNLALELIGTGEQAGVWGTTTNTNLGTLIEQAISGYVTQAVSTGTDTTITIPNGSSGVARNMYIELTGTGGTNTNLIVPANKKLYFIFNNSTGAVTVKVSGQTGVSVPTGKKMVLVSNGTDIVNGLNYIADFASNSATITHLSATSATITNLTLTSLVISNLSIASANITTLTGSTQTLSGNLTLSGGTANGVAYLNGSKVLTSGTALTFSGTTFAVTGAAGSLDINPTSGQPNITIRTGNTFRGYIEGNSSGGLSFGSGPAATIGMVLDSSQNCIWSPAGSEAMRLTSTGLGIGTASPAAKLHVVGENAILDRSGGDPYLAFYTSGSTTNVNIYGGSSTGFRVFTGGSERLRVDSSGQLGLGVTPSAWLSPFRAQQIGSGIGSLALAGRTDGGDDFFIGRNVFYGGSPADFRYIGTGTATRYRCDGATHAWSIAASGTAGNAISFTQAMTLDASGRLGVGLTSPNAPIEVQSDSGGTGIIIRGRVSANTSTLRFYANDGTTQQAKFEANDSVVEVGSITNVPLLLYANGSERARITSGGDLLVGTTSGTDGRVKVDGTSNAAGVAFWGKNSGAAVTPTHVMWNNSASGDNKFIDFYTEASATLRGSIDYNRAGGLVRYNTTSDYRAKDILGPVQNSGATIDALKVYEGVMKGATQSRPMLIAHEAQEYAPYAVSGVKDEVKEDGTPKYQQIDVSAFVPLLLAELQSLRKRVAELESK